uniref:RNA-directed DNA polymerase n=1 Tax=Culicoides sonorensis TaxID=179676 RepID=A0A336LSG4_CULSO
MEQQLPKALKLEEFNETCQQDEESQKIKYTLKYDVWPIELKKYEIMKNELSIVDNTVLRGMRLVVPKNLRDRILNLAQEPHPGLNRTKMRLRQKVWWRLMNKDVENLISKCYSCKLVKNDLNPEPLIRHEMPHAIGNLFVEIFLVLYRQVMNN